MSIPAGESEGDEMTATEEARLIAYLEKQGWTPAQILDLIKGDNPLRSDPNNGAYAISEARSPNVSAFFIFFY